MSVGKHKVGDWVRVRQWDDMQAEYGLNYKGDISVPLVFTSSMRHFCGHWCKITAVYSFDYSVEFKFESNNYHWSDEMLEPKPEYKPGDVVMLRSWADMAQDFPMYSDNITDNPTYFVGDFSNWFIDSPLTIRAIKKYNGDGKNGIEFEDIPELPRQFRYMEFTPYCIDHIVKDTAITIQEPLLSFADLFAAQ